MALRWLNLRDRAAVGALFGILLGTGALIAVIALAFDLARANFEQEALRNSAGAASLAVAVACSNSQESCSSKEGAETLAQAVLDQNQAAQEIGLISVCGSAPLDPCTIPSGQIWECREYVGDKNLVRVNVASANNGDLGLAVFFTEQDSVDIRGCGQAEWSTASSDALAQTEFDLGFPLCDYPGDQTPVVWYQFQNRYNSTPDSEVDCQLDLGDGAQNFEGLTNGVAGIDLDTGECDIQVSIPQTQNINLGETNLSKLCDREIEDYLDELIASEESAEVVILGQFERYNPSNISFTPIGSAEIRILGYRIKNNSEGGQAPAGGWGNYPEDLPQNKKCAASRPCFYGYYVSVPELQQSSGTARLVFE